MQTFHSDLKKNMVRNLHVNYDISPSKNAKTAEECSAQIKHKADKLLSSVTYLQEDIDANVQFLPHSELVLMYETEQI